MKKFPYKILTVGLFMGLYSCVDDPTMSSEVIGADKPAFEGQTQLMETTASTIKVTARISAANGYEITERGFFYGTSPSPEDGGIQIPDTTGAGIGAYSSTFKGLKNNTRYYFRPYATNLAGTRLGDEVDTTTNSGIVGAIETLILDSIRAASARVGGKIGNIGEGEIISMGVYLTEKNKSNIIDTIYSANAIIEVREGTIFTCRLSGLNPSTWYYVQAFATNTYGTTEGDIDSLQTLDGKLAISETKAYPGFTDVKMTSYVTTVGDETVAIIDRGFCWAIETVSEYPTLDHNVERCESGGAGDFEGTISDLSPKQRYYVRAFATNNFGRTFYDDESLVVVTLTDVPAVRTNTVTIFPNGSADVGGTVDGIGMSAIITSGICWSTTNPNPTLDDAVLPLISGGIAGSVFFGRLTQLKGGTTYYVRAFATNSQGTGYAEEVRQFTTPPVFTNNLQQFSGASRFAMAYFAIDAYLYFLGGDLGMSFSDELWRYSINSNSWEQLSSFIDSPAKWQTGVTYGQGSLIYGGTNKNGDEKPGIYHYRAPQENSWTYYDGPPDSAIVHRTIGYSYSHNVYYIGGISADTVRDDVWSFDYSTKIWVQKTVFPLKQYDGVAVVIDNTAYVGMGSDINGICNNILWATTDGATTWNYQTAYAVTGNVLGGVVCNRRLYIIDESYHLIEYNPETDVWTRKSPLPAGHNNEVHCIYMYNNKIYIGLESKSFVIYDPVWDN